MDVMRGSAIASCAIVFLATSVLAQEPKPVPKDSTRVSISGCAKGYVFTAGPTIANLPRSIDLPEGTHLRMNGPKRIMDALIAHKESMIQITGLMKKDQFQQGGVAVGGVRIAPGPSGATGGAAPSITPSLAQIDVEGWSPAPGTCSSK
jgi:hypothetical protein